MGRVGARVRNMSRGSVATSIIVAAEMRFGVENRASERLRQSVDAVLEAISVFPFASPADVEYAKLRAHLVRTGERIGPNDALIAAHALALGAILVTANVSEFQRVPGLKIENWLA